MPKARKGTLKVGLGRWDLDVGLRLWGSRLKMWGSGDVPLEGDTVPFWPTTAATTLTVIFDSDHQLPFYPQRPAQKTQFTDTDLHRPQTTDIPTDLL